MSKIIVNDWKKKTERKFDCIFVVFLIVNPNKNSGHYKIHLNKKKNTIMIKLIFFLEKNLTKIYSGTNVFITQNDLVASRINLPDQASGLWSCAELSSIVPCPDRQTEAVSSFIHAGHPVHYDQCCSTFQINAEYFTFRPVTVWKAQVTDSTQGDDKDIGFWFYYYFVIKPTKLQTC